MSKLLLSCKCFFGTFAGHALFQRIISWILKYKCHTSMTMRLPCLLLAVLKNPKTRAHIARSHQLVLKPFFNGIDFFVLFLFSNTDTGNSSSRIETKTTIMCLHLSSYRALIFHLAPHSLIIINSRVLRGFRKIARKGRISSPSTFFFYGIIRHSSLGRSKQKEEGISWFYYQVLKEF